MADALARTYLRGILIPDPEVTAATMTVDADYMTQAGTTPDTPVPNQVGDAALSASGTIAAGSELEVLTLVGGFPGVNEAQIAWRYVGDDMYRGWRPPVSITGFEFIDRSTTAGTWRHPHGVRLASGRLLVAAVKSNQYIVVQASDNDGTTWTEVEVYDKGGTYTASPHPTLVATAGGRVLAFWWRESSGYYTIRGAYSDDDGDTWSTLTRAALLAPLASATYTPKRLRAAELDGQIILLGHVQTATEDRIFHWASTNGGARLTTVAEWSGTQVGYPDVVASAGRLYVGYVAAGDAATWAPYVRVLGSAYDDVTTSLGVLAQADDDPMQWASTSGGLFNSGELALAVDDGGIVYVYGRDHASSTKEGAARVSVNLGETWTDVGSSTAAAAGVTWWNAQDADTYPTGFSALSAGSRVLLLHTFAGDDTTADDSLCVFYLGGYATVTLPVTSSAAPDLRDVVGWERTLPAYELPEDLGGLGTSVTVNAPTVTLTGLGVRVQGGGTDSQAWYITTATSDENGSIVEVTGIKVVSGTWYCTIESATAFVGHRVRVAVTTTTITMTDDLTGALLGTVSTTAATTGMDLLLALGNDAGTPGNDGKVAIWYAPHSTGPDRAWVEAATVATLHRGATAGDRFTWGVVAAVGTDVYTHRLVQACFGTYTGEQLYGGQTTYEMIGRPLGPDGVELDDGTVVRLERGPTKRGDAWTISPRFEYPALDVNPDQRPTPSRGHRATNEAETHYTWEWSTPRLPMGALLGVHIAGANFPGAELWYKNTVGTWSKVCDLDLKAATSLKFAREGAVVLADLTGSTAAPWFLHEGMLSGWTWASGTTRRKIVWNAEGAWSTTTTLAPRLQLQDVEVGDPSSGTNGALWASSYTAIVPWPSTRVCRGLRVRVPAASTADGAIRSAVIMAGRVAVLGHDYSHGRALEQEVYAELLETQGGARRGRELAPPRRAVEMAWTDGVVQRATEKLAPAPDYVAAWDGGPAVATPGSTLMLLRGLLRHQGGAAKLGVLLPWFAQPSSDSQVIEITRPDQHYYGRITTVRARQDSIRGEEARGEWSRGGTIRFEEET